MRCWRGIVVVCGLAVSLGGGSLLGQSAPPAAPAATEPAAAAPAQAPTAADAKPAAEEAGKDAAKPTAAKPGKDKHSLFSFKSKKEKPPKLVPVTIQRGILTVDGWTGKADLNYVITDLKFLYIWAPGVGTAVVSNEPFDKAKLQGGAFDGRTLTVVVDGHTLQLTSEHHLINSKLPVAAYVELDKTYVPESPNYPQFGYGVTSKAPYTWPSSLANYVVNPKAPPLPSTMLPPLKQEVNCVTKPDGTKGPCTTTPMVMYPDKDKKKDK